MSLSTASSVRAALLLAVVVLVCAGCTARQSQQQHEQQLESALAERDQVVAQIDNRSLRTPDDYAAASQRVGRAIEQLRGDPPPRNVQPAFDRLVEAMFGLEGLLGKLGHCAGLEQSSAKQAEQCRDAIGQETYDTIRDDFSEANSIYRASGYSMPRFGSDELAGEDDVATSGGDDL